MFIRKLSVTNIRSHIEYELNLGEYTSIITGNNGSGKTSLLEALYLSQRGSSFKGTDQDMLRTDAPWWRISVQQDDMSNRTITYDPSRTTGKKQFVSSQKTKNYRLPVKDKYPVVLFEPEDLRLLSGSPARRRKFIDEFISQIDPTYQTSIRKYERALRQRNNLLKQPSTTNNSLFVWNVMLAEYGSLIIKKRQEAIQYININLTEQYQSIAKKDDNVESEYSYKAEYNQNQQLLKDLEQSVQRDKQLGYTSIGPHRHDVFFLLNNSPAISTASRGEVRTILLALKIQEINQIHALLNKKPLVLLDDIFSELDTDRQANIEAAIKDHQVVMTSTHRINTTNNITHIELDNN
jgi:DNA replication and repair protein RecF